MKTILKEIFDYIPDLFKNLSKRDRDNVVTEGLTDGKR